MRRPGLIVAILVLTVDVLYVWYVVFVQGSGSDQPWTVPFVAAYLAALAVCAVLVATLPAATWRLAFLGAAAIGLLVLGFFALMSIGLPLFVMGFVSAAVLVNTIRHSAQRRRALTVLCTGALLSISMLFAGFAVTERIIACPPGAVSGSGSGMFSGSYTYTCQNGHAIVRFGQ